MKIDYRQCKTEAEAIATMYALWDECEKVWATGNQQKYDKQYKIAKQAKQYLKRVGLYWEETEDIYAGYAG